MMVRISEMLEDDGKKRYHNFLKQRPDLIQRISLEIWQIISVLPRFLLSRIRAQKF
jgi:hypothetical protein